MSEPNEDASVAHLTTGRRLLLDHRLEQAISELRRAIEASPNLAEAHLRLGEAEAALGRHRLAAAAFKRALEISPELSDAAFALARSYLEAGLPGKAITALCEMRDLDPDYRLAECEDILQRALASFGGDGEIIKFLRAEVFWHPASFHRRLALAAALEKGGDYRDAATAYAGCFALRPADARPLRSVGRAKRSMGLLDEAAKTFVFATQSNPHDHVAHFLLGVTFLELGRIAEGALSLWRAFEQLGRSERAAIRRRARHEGSHGKRS